MAFQKASKQTAFAKVGAFGPTGSGKTTLVAMLALYLSKSYHGSAPVAMQDTEKGSDFILPFFEAEGVELLVDKTRAFADLRDGHAEALKLGACAIIDDSLTHFWAELKTALMDQEKVTRLDVGLIGKLKDNWAPFAENFVNAPIHWLVSGRLGHEWEQAEYEDGDRIKRELVKTGTKMKTEGEFGHEPDLLVEMASVEDPDALDYRKVKGRLRKDHSAKMVHVATVKKCRVWALNGKVFSWPDADTYKPGDYKKVAECFLPYLQFLNIGGVHRGADASRNSRELFSRDGDRAYRRGLIAKQAALEEWDATMEKLWPGQSAKAKELRSAVGEAITTVRSRTKFEQFRLEDLQFCVSVLMALESRLAKEPTDDKDTILAQVAMAREDSGRSSTEDALGVTNADVAAAAPGGPF